MMPLLMMPTMPPLSDIMYAATCHATRDDFHDEDTIFAAAADDSLSALPRRFSAAFAYAPMP